MIDRVILPETADENLLETSLTNALNYRFKLEEILSPLQDKAGIHGFRYTGGYGHTNDLRWEHDELELKLYATPKPGKEDYPDKPIKFELYYRDQMINQTSRYITEDITVSTYLRQVRDVLEREVVNQN